MSSDFPNLFERFELRGKRFKNRLFFGPHGTGYAEGGGIGERGLAYYKARVDHGVALLVTEAHQVVPLRDQPYPQLSAGSDACIASLSRLADLCAPAGCRLFGQLYHEGRARAHSVDGSLEVAVAPSALPDERFHVMPRAMTVAEIEEMVHNFAVAAARMKAGGVDGVELLVGMGYLHAQFLSPHTNHRTDAYGGTPENRRRFLAETLRAMREAVGEDVIVGFRMAPEEPDIDGQRTEDSVATCAALAREGLTDYISVTVGGTHTLAGASHIVPSMFVPVDATLDAGRAVRAAVDVPVFLCGRINQPQQGEAALASGAADMVGLVRALICDPAFPSKSDAGRADDIRACIGCNQACIGHRATGHGVSCIQFPETGREQTFGIRTQIREAKRVMVVGGGPAGMKAAAVAAERGHTVTLYERAATLGGQALLAQALPHRAEFGGLITNLQSELQRYGVRVCTGNAATGEEANADVVIVATGAVPHWPDCALDDAHVVTAWDVVRGTANVGSRVVVADWRGDWIGLGVAELLAQSGCAVRLAVNGETAGSALQSYVRHQWAGRLHRLGVEVMPYMRLFGADADTVYLQHVMTGEPHLCEGVDTLVLSTGHRSVDGVSPAFEARGVPVLRIGDCLSPRTAEEAVLEGLRAGTAI